jgi:hypothetical protein
VLSFGGDFSEFFMDNFEMFRCAVAPVEGRSYTFSREYECEGEEGVIVFVFIPHVLPARLASVEMRQRIPARGGDACVMRSILEANDVEESWEGGMALAGGVLLSQRTSPDGWLEMELAYVGRRPLLPMW